MTRTEEIKNKSYELGQKYFPDVNNVWARANIEAQYVSNACMEIAQWADSTLLDKACEWLDSNAEKYAIDGGLAIESLIYAFKKAMEL